MYSACRQCLTMHYGFEDTLHSYPVCLPKNGPTECIARALWEIAQPVFDEASQ